MIIELKKQYCTESGDEVRIYAIDGGWTTPVHGAVKRGGHWVMCGWDAEGKNKNFLDSSLDLVEIRPRIKREYWVNVYEKGHIGCYYDTKKEAEKYRDPEVKSCVKVVIDCEEGEGL